MELITWPNLILLTTEPATGSRQKTPPLRQSSEHFGDCLLPFLPALAQELAFGVPKNMEWNGSRKVCPARGGWVTIGVTWGAMGTTWVLLVAYLTVAFVFWLGGGDMEGDLGSYEEREMKRRNGCLEDSIVGERLKGSSGFYNRFFAQS